MNDPIVATNHNVTLVGGGDLADADFALARSHAPMLVAADSGADSVLAQGFMPDAVIGDLDSISQNALQAVPKGRIHRIAEQESTDFDKALRNIASPLILAVGFLGARIDHQMAVMNTLCRQAGRPCVLIGGGQLTFAAPRTLSLDLQAGDVVSLFPMRRVTGRSQGLRWPIDGLDFTPDGRVGTSNEATGPVSLQFDQLGMLVILPDSTLPHVSQVLRATPAGRAD